MSATPTGQVRLNAEHIAKTYTTGIWPLVRKNQVLKDASLQVRAGEIVALVGANGSGKSTLMMIIAGALARDRGAITIHGTYFPYSLRAPHAGKVFVVGDAAGMCLGLTREGIRPALFFGEAYGQIVRRILAGDLSLHDGLAEYTHFVASRAHFFHTFSAVQTVLSRAPGWGGAALALVLTRDPWRSWLFRKYWGLTRGWPMS